MTNPRLHILIAMLALASTAFAGAPSIKPLLPTADVNLAWDASNPSSDVAHYRAYYGTASGDRSNFVEVAGDTTTATIPGLTIGTTYYFVATALNEWGTESAPSSELVYTVPGPAPAPPGNLRVVTLALQSSIDLQNWNTFAVVEHSPTTRHAQFYRLLISK